MYLKKYQLKVVNELKHFFETAKSQRSLIEAAASSLPADLRNTLDYVKQTFGLLKKPYPDACTNGLGKHYPRVTIKVPTGGGKTMLAVEAIREYHKLFTERKTGLVIWIVPKDTIYTQTLARLRDKRDPYRQLLDQASGGKTIIKEKGQTLSLQEVEENLVVLFVMIQAIHLAKNRKSLKAFQDSGGYDSFFPQDNRYDLQGQWLKEVPNLDTFWADGGRAQLVTSLANAVRVSKPLIIIDEIHRVFTPTAKATIDSLNPEMVIGLSATPQAGMNILSTVSGLELKEEDMVKLDLHIRPPAKGVDNDWKGMLSEIKMHREQLEQQAVLYRQNMGEYIRPIALIQVERVGKDQRGKRFVHSEDVKEYLMSMGVNPDEIAIKSSIQNDIKDTDLFSAQCPVRFIITKEALSEGWDCSFAYTLGIIPDVQSNTSVTQLIGRILRQPRAKKTGIQALDESYVYYCKGDTGTMLERIRAGFQAEGLGDLVSKMKVRGLETVNPTKQVTIKEAFRQYEYAFYLPVWLMLNEDRTVKRRFSYDVDIRPFINFHDYALSESLLNRIEESLSEESKTHKAFAVTINEESKATFQEENAGQQFQDAVSLQYLSRRFSEVIDNAFLARKVSKQCIKKLTESLGQDRLAAHFSYISSLLTKDLKANRQRQEEGIFLRHLEESRLELAISDDPAIGYKIPGSDQVTVSNMPNSYAKNLFTDVEVAGMNSLEKSVASILEDQSKLLWWFRNRVGKKWYAVQGWHEHKIWPDFVAAKKRDDDSVEVIYIIESKGEHLAGNPSTLYKKKVMDEMNRLKNEGRLHVYQRELSFGVLNQAVEASMVEQNKEEETLRSLMR